MMELSKEGTEMKTVHEVALLCGISVRTLHYYDQIGLLHPAGTTQAGYRLYGERELARLQQILFFRELDFPLKEIAAILDSPSFDQNRALISHREVLTLKRERLNGLIRLVDQLLKGETNMSLKEFDTTEIEQAQRRYAEEAAQRWGGTEAFAQSVKKTDRYGRADWARINAEAKSIFEAFAAQMQSAPDSPAVQQLVGQWREYLTANFYDCTLEILGGLGEMYTADARFAKNLDAYGEGLARFLSEAIRCYCKAHAAE